MAERDKIRLLAEKLEPESDWSTGEIERILRTALEPLLEAAQHGVDISSGEDCPECAVLAAELRHWNRP